MWEFENVIRHLAVENDSIGDLLAFTANKD